ncbi:AEC family transporter [Epibacterium ulvae]|uniref:AEC family transporter n=1 Tax=Epibacterium ulvae TaxID=1156985 RepID=UPI0024927E62|nr:AEC family transporter [Epibacterium ulvae]
MFQSLIDVILPIFLVVGSGYFTTKFNYISQSNVEGLMKFAQNFAIPLLLFNAISTLDLSASFNPALLSSFYSAAFLCFLIGIFGARLFFRRPWEDAIAIGFCCLFSNSLLLGLPITERAFGSDNLTGNYAIIAFHSPFCYAVGITTMEIVRNQGGSLLQTGKSVFKAMFQNVLILAILLGFVVNVSGLQIPTIGTEAIDLITRAALPCALFALGGVLVQYKPEGDMRTILFVCFTSLMIHPALVWLFGSLQALPQDLFRSGVVNAAMATGFNGYIFANLYGKAKRVAASSVLFATGFSIFTVWFWLTLLGS